MLFLFIQQQLIKVRVYSVKMLHFYGRLNLSIYEITEAVNQKGNQYEVMD